jgi:hypothetical protein
MIEGNEEEIITKHMLSGNVSPNSPKGIHILHILDESGIIQFNSFNFFEGEACRIIRGGMPLSLGPGWVD